jgi:hypothetical protein
MTALGQTRRFCDVRSMSDVTPTADISGPSRHFAFVPLGEMDEPLGLRIARRVKPFYDPRWGKLDWPVRSAD